MLRITDCIHFSKPHMNTKTVAMFCHAIQGITMLENNIVNTNGDVIHFVCKQRSWASQFTEI